MFFRCSGRHLNWITFGLVFPESPTAICSCCQPSPIPSIDCDTATILNYGCSADIPLLCFFFFHSHVNYVGVTGSGRADIRLHSWFRCLWKKRKKWSDSEKFGGELKVARSPWLSAPSETQTSLIRADAITISVGVGKWKKKQSSILGACSYFDL